MDSSDEEVLLDLVFSLKLSSGVNQKKKQKKKRKRMRMREIFIKRIEQVAYHNLLQVMRVNDRESHFRLFVK